MKSEIVLHFNLYVSKQKSSAKKFILKLHGRHIFLLTRLSNSVTILIMLVFLKEGEEMDYEELAKQFLHNSYQYRSRGHQKRFDDSMHGETFAMSYIFRQGGTVLPSDISSEMNISSARVAAMLNNLENKGLITREIDKSDRRRVLVELTQDGIEFAKNHNKTVVNYTIRTLKLLGEHDAKELVRIIGRLSELSPEMINNK